MGTRRVWLWVLLSLGMGVAAQRTRTWCRIKCGVVTNEGDSSSGKKSWLDLVRAAWNDLTSRKGISDIEIQFVGVHRRKEITIDMLIEAYMEIGTTNISAMVGPYVVPLATATEKFGIPYFVTTPLEHSFYRPFNMISVSPDPMDIMTVATEVAKRYLWDVVTVIYDNDEGARLIERLVLMNTLRVRSWKVYRNSTREDIRLAMLSVRNLHVPNIMLVAARPLAVKILDAALHLSMLARDYSWVIPNLNLNQADLKPYEDTQVNFTTFKLVQESFTGPKGSEAYSGFRTVQKDFSELDYATTLDSLLTLYHGIKSHYRRSKSCHWSGRQHILHILPKIGDKGATGKLTFRDDGTRDGYIVDILGLGQSGTTHNNQKFGFWNSSEEISRRLYLNVSLIPHREEEPTAPTPDSHVLRQGVLRIAAVLAPPYIQLKKDHHGRSGNDRYEGFCIDLLSDLSEKLAFYQYELSVATDGRIGDKQKDGRWNGLVGELLYENATMAFGPLTITSSRDEVIDFSKPFKQVGVSMVIKRPTTSEGIFYFMDPLSPLLWVVLGGILVLLSITLYVVDRVAPSDEDKVRLTAQKCVWFTCSSMVLRTVEITPKTLSGRILAGAVWFFSLVMVSAYTANFAALLTASKLHTPVRSMADLIGQTKVKYGTVKDSHISAFFETSKVNPFQNIWTYMSKVDPSSSVLNATAGFQKAKSSENYAFLWDSSEIRTKINEDCDVIEVGQTVYFKAYGIGIPHGVRYRDPLNMAVLQLSESGRLHELERRWWQDNLCPDPDDPRINNRPLSIEKVTGLFILLGLVIFVALGISVAEYVLRTKRRKRTTKNRVSQKYKTTSFTWRENCNETNRPKPQRKYINEKVAEENISSKPLCDGNTSAAIQSAAEEPFLTPATYPRASKHETNIF